MSFKIYFISFFKGNSSNVSLIEKKPNLNKSILTIVNMKIKKPIRAKIVPIALREDCAWAKLTKIANTHQTLKKTQFVSERSAHITSPIAAAHNEILPALVVNSFLSTMILASTGS